MKLPLPSCCKDWQAAAESGELPLETEADINHNHPNNPTVLTSLKTLITLIISVTLTAQIIIMPLVTHEFVEVGLGLLPANVA